MPARGEPKPPAPPQAKDQWLSAFVDEYLRLRPHSKDEHGFPSRHVHQIASLQWGTNSAVDPKVAAQRYHAAMPLKPKTK